MDSPVDGELAVLSFHNVGRVLQAPPAAAEF
jgi:hypothetical protein